MTQLQMYGKFIGLYQILGSVIGLYYLINLMLDSTLSNTWVTIVMYVPILIFSVIAGYDAFRYYSFRWTFYNLYIQIIQFKLFGFAFYYIAGVYIGLGVIFPTELYFDLSLYESIFFLRFNFSGGQDVFGVNLFSIVLVLLTYYVVKQKNNVDIEIS